MHDAASHAIAHLSRYGLSPSSLLQARRLLYVTWAGDPGGEREDGAMTYGEVATRLRDSLAELLTHVPPCYKISGKHFSREAPLPGFGKRADLIQRYRTIVLQYAVEIARTHRCALRRDECLGLAGLDRALGAAIRVAGRSLSERDRGWAPGRTT